MRSNETITMTILYVAFHSAVCSIWLTVPALAQDAAMPAEAIHKQSPIDLKIAKVANEASTKLAFGLLTISNQLEPKHILRIPSAELQEILQTQLNLDAETTRVKLQLLAAGLFTLPTGIYLQYSAAKNCLRPNGRMSLQCLGGTTAVMGLGALVAANIINEDQSESDYWHPTTEIILTEVARTRASDSAATLGSLLDWTASQRSTFERAFQARLFRVLVRGGVSYPDKHDVTNQGTYDFKIAPASLDPLEIIKTYNLASPEQLGALEKMRALTNHNSDGGSQKPQGHAAQQEITDPFVTANSISYIEKAVDTLEEVLLAPRSVAAPDAKDLIKKIRSDAQEALTEIHRLEYIGRTQVEDHSPQSDPTQAPAVSQ